LPGDEPRRRMNWRRTAAAAAAVAVVRHVHEIIAKITKTN